MTLSSVGKLGDNWVNNGPITQNNSLENTMKRKESDDSVLIKKAKKLYDIKHPTISPSISNNKPRLPSDISKLNVIVDIMISDTDSASGPVYEEYQKNMDEQESNHHLNKSPNLFQFLKQSLSGTLDEMLDFIWDKTNYCGQNTKIELQFIRFLQYFLTDYHANCTKPLLQGSSNERTPFSEHVIPVFKYFTAATGLLSFAWCEKQSASNKGLLICFPENYKRKLMDGIGYSVKDNIERVLLECSGKANSTHTEEDTLKLIECTTNCLIYEMNQYRSASWTTFGRRKMIAVQSIKDKVTLLSSSKIGHNRWSFVEQRSTVIPRNWNDKWHIVKLVELLLVLQNMLIEQEKVTEDLKLEHLGLKKVDPEDIIRKKS
ncbi:hypothetical protein CLU79DRAFT_735019 [Phycomyces nitens]|nr:hypothetical protein CLU79DRAFT_735019 [Phycomyces nitens]